MKKLIFITILLVWVPTAYAAKGSHIKKALKKTRFQVVKSLAEQEYGSAQYSLGSMYEKGKAVEQDEIYAYAWYLIAEINKHKEAENKLKELNKRMTLKDIEKAKELSASCRKSNYRKCKAPLFSLKKEDFLSFIFYSLATAVGALIAAKSTGVIKKFGEFERLSLFNQGLSAYDKGNYPVALKMWKPLAEDGDPDAQFYLAKWHADLENYDEAEKWYRKAANQGHPKAKTVLANLKVYGKIEQEERTI